MEHYFWKRNMANSIFDVINIFIMILFVLIMVYPFINLMAISFNDGADAAGGGIYFFPHKLSFQSYQYVFQNPKLLHSLWISVLRVVVGTSTSLFATGLLAYIITIRNFSGRKFIRLIFIITMYFNGGLIPTYLVMLKLGLSNSFNVYWLPVLINTYYMLLMASYMQELPDSLGESARIDGASELLIYFRIIMPTALPVFAAVAIYFAVIQWNSWFDTALYNTNRKWDTLQTILNRLLNEAQALQDIRDQQLILQKFRQMTPQTVRAATTIIVTIPIVIVYPFLQKYFVGGLTIGGVKG
jgi:ABC-type sugar transport system, permease component